LTERKAHEALADAACGAADGHAAAERIITLGGDVTEMVYALDAQRSWSRATAPAPGLPPRKSCPMWAICAS
jgi:hypothetical protein